MTNVNKKELVELSFLYFRLRNLFNDGFQRYLFFRNLISYSCGITNYPLIRRVFEDLVIRNTFDIKIKRGMIYYLFNPTNKFYDDSPDCSINWD